MTTQLLHHLIVDDQRRAVEIRTRRFLPRLLGR